MSKLLVVLLCLINALSAQAAKLTLPENFRVLVINGEEQSFNFFALPSSVKLKRGLNVARIQYRGLFEGNEDDTIKVYSAPIRIAFDWYGNDSLQLTAPLFENEEAARVYAQSPVFSLVNSLGQLVPFTRRQGGLQESDAGLSQHSEPDNEQMLKNAIKLNSQNTKLGRAIETDQQNLKTNQKITPNPLTLLKFWWEKADNHQRNAFLQHLNTSRSDNHE